MNAMADQAVSRPGSRSCGCKAGSTRPGQVQIMCEDDPAADRWL